MRLVIEIELGNDAMQSASDASRAITPALLNQASSMLQPLNPHECGSIRDTNGNTIGEWRVEPE